MPTSPSSPTTPPDPAGPTTPFRPGHHDDPLGEPDAFPVEEPWQEGDVPPGRGDDPEADR